MTHNEAVIVLTEQIQDHLPEEKWRDYEDAVTLVLHEVDIYRDGMLHMSDGIHNLVEKYTEGKEK